MIIEICDVNDIVLTMEFEDVFQLLNNFCTNFIFNQASNEEINTISVSSNLSLCFWKNKQTISLKCNGSSVALEKEGIEELFEQADEILSVLLLYHFTDMLNK